MFLLAVLVLELLSPGGEAWGCRWECCVVDNVVDDAADVVKHRFLLCFAPAAAVVAPIVAVHSSVHV